MYYLPHKMGVKIIGSSCPRCHKFCSLFTDQTDEEEIFYSSCCGVPVMGVNGPPPKKRNNKRSFHVHKINFPLYNPHADKNMKDDVNKKIMLDLFVAPFVLVPVIGGLTCLILSVGIGSLTMAASGFMATLAGIGVFATKLIFGLDKITEKAYQNIMEEKEKAFEDTLDKLDQNLRQDRDPRPEQCLQELRSMQKILKESEESTLAAQIKDDFNRLFEICVRQIKQTDDLWRTSKELNGKAKQNIKDQREKIITELEATVQQLGISVQQIKTVGSKQNDAELEDAKREFEQRIEIAKKVDQRLANLNDKGYDPKEFLKEE